MSEHCKIARFGVIGVGVGAGAGAGVPDFAFSTLWSTRS